MSDSYTVVTHGLWGGHLKNALFAAVVGFLLCWGAFVLLFWNEGRAVQRAQTLDRGARIVNPINANQIYSIYEGKLVYLSGKATTDETLIDDMFGVTVSNVIKLRRVVEMYQWQERQQSETREKWGGDTETVTTYTYRKIWSKNLIESSEFKQPQGHLNPSFMPVEGNLFIAELVTIGKFTLSSSLVENLNNYQHLPINNETLGTSQIQLSEKKIHLNYGSYYMGENPAHPKTGDLRIKFEVVLPATISVVALQSNSYLTAYTTEAGGEIELFEYGVVDVQTLFKNAQWNNVINTWILRLAGFVMMFLGLLMIFGVLGILAAVIPFLGYIVGLISGFIAFILALALSLITIALAWLFYRPLLGIIFFFIAAELLFLLKWVPRSQSTQNTNPEQPVFESQSVLKSQKPNLTSEAVVPQKVNDLEAIKF